MSLKRYEGKIAGSYDLEETIGKGHFAVVKLARHVYSGEKVAVKVIDKNKLDEVSKAHLFQEVGCMKLVQHPNVVRLYEVIDTPSKLYLIMELGDGGDMYDFISRHSQGLEEETARRYFRQVTHAINYCHQLHVVHRDLKLENVVIFEKLGIVKLTDFGFSNKFIPGSKLETSCGSLAYSAPEILLGDSYDAPAVDVWSLGVIIYMLVCGELPFQEANDSETLTKIMDCSYHLPAHISRECQDLISLMLVRDPHKRITLSGILSHVWLTRGDPAPLPLLPLITWEHLTQEEHTLIINKMVARKMASKEEILQALEENAYNHITATYYLLAESRLRKQRERAAHLGHHRPSPGSPASSMGSSPSLSPVGSATDNKAKLAPLALSPRLPTPDLSPDTPDSLVPLPGVVRRTTRSPTDRKVLSRKCSLIQEEVLEEEEMDVDSEATAIRDARPTEESLSDDSDSRSTTAGAAPSSRGRTAPAPRRQLPVRPLHSVRSSPQLLQIHEEGSGDEDDILLPLTSTADTSPLRHKSRLSPRGHPTNYSSSDTSDTDDTDTRRRHHRGDRLKGRLQRRDSSENSSDTDGGPAAGVRGPGAPGRLWSSRPHRPTDKNKSKSGTNNNRTSSSGGGRQNNAGTSPSRNSPHGKNGGHSPSRNSPLSRTGGSSPSRNSPHGKNGGHSPSRNSVRGTSPSQNSLLGKRDSSSDRDNSHNEIGCKMSNISISSSNKSTVSGGRGQKYVSEDDKAKDVEAALNEENKAKSRIIHVRSKNFSDLMERFSASKQGAVEEPGIVYGGQTAPVVQEPPASNKVRNRRSGQQQQHRAKTDINRNGLISGQRSDNEAETVPLQTQQQQQPGMNNVRTKCCSVV